MSPLLRRLGTLHPIGRIARHALFAMMSAGAVAAAVQVLASEYRIFKLSIGTAYASLAFFSAALLVGPWQVLRRRTHPLSSHFRRDLGIWAGILGLVHVVLGLQVHSPGRP